MQTNTFESHFVACGPDSGLTLPDSCKIAEAYGFPTYYLKSNDDVNNKLEEILNTEGSLVCELYVDPLETVSSQVKAIKLKEGSMMSMPIEKMWPCLSD